MIKKPRDGFDVNAFFLQQGYTVESRERNRSSDYWVITLKENIKDSTIRTNLEAAYEQAQNKWVWEDAPEFPEEKKLTTTR